ncbi:hypothetical protein BH09BAC6_BH09BAC6_13590 [soil metagenome]
MQDTIAMRTIADNDQQRLAILNQYHLLDTPQFAIEAANVGTWFMDVKTNVFIPSVRMKELFGYKPDEEMLFDAALNQITNKYRKKVTEAIQYAITQRTQFCMDFPVSGYSDQRLRWVKAMGGLNDDAASGFSHFSGVIMDITEQKQNELRKNKFIGMVSHELKTPLTSLKAYLQMLQNWAKKQKDNFTIGALSKVEKQVKKMNTMINGFLNLSGVESGQIHLNEQDFNLNDLVNEVIEETMLITPTHKIVQLPCEAIIIHADRDKVEQVMINLVSNAIKYSPKDKSIEVRCRVDANMASVCVKDEWMGISQGDAKKLFEPHYRVESSETKKIPGFGIGLYLSSEIIKRHKGEIWVDSELGKGSEFYFTLPVNKN